MRVTPERWQQVRELLYCALQLDPGKRPAYLESRCSTDPLLRNELEALLCTEQQLETDFLEPAVRLRASMVNASPIKSRIVPPETQFAELLNTAATEAKQLNEQPALELDEEGALASEDLIGRRLGSYKIIERIGSGGMADVYRAFRADDQYRKQVAIKVVRQSRRSKTVIERFKGERQILADLDHPNIAHLLDGGTTEAGDPFFVMELIEGLPIDEYCDHKRLGIPERLGLFCQVCSAVQYAHRHLIVHRDIKPSNILVTSDGVPKLVDFGIAKILDTPAFGLHLEPTLTAFRPLTPGYASPEQVTGGTITTASDIYSLGVVLYQLLAGRSPYRLTTYATHEITRAICELEPERLSTTVLRVETVLQEKGGVPIDATEIAALRQSSPDRLSKRLRGDLDNIALVALRKEPQRRYASVEQLAQDINRHLVSLPVMARKDTLRYRTSKFVNRYKMSVLAAGLITLTLLTALVLLIRATRLARQESDIAQVERTRAERRLKDIRELSNSLMFDIHDSIQDLPGSTPARKMIVERSLRYLDRLAGESKDDKSLQRELATAYEKVATVQGDPFGANLGDSQGAIASYRKAAQIWESLIKGNPNNPADLLGLAGTYRHLAGTLANDGGGDALAELQKLLELSQRMDALVSSDLKVAEELELDYEMAGEILCRTGGDAARSLESLDKAFTLLCGQLRGKVDDRVLRQRESSIRKVMGESLAELGKRSEALEQFRLGIEILRSSPEREHLRDAVAALQFKRGDVLMMSGDAAGALRCYHRQQAILEPQVAADPQNADLRVALGAAYASVGHALSWQYRGNEALPFLEKAAVMLEPLAGGMGYGQARSELGRSQNWAGELHATLGNDNLALENYRRAAAESLTLATLLPFDRYHQSRLAASHNKIGDILTKMGKLGEAADEYQRALAAVTPVASPTPQNDLPWYTVADTYFGLGELSRTEALHSSGHTNRQRELWSQARTWYQQSVDAWRRIPNPGVMTSAGYTCGNLARVRRALAQCDAALSARGTPMSKADGQQTH